MNQVLGRLNRSVLLYWLASMTGSGLNMVYTRVVVGTLSPVAFGNLSLIISVQLILSIVVVGYQTMVNSFGAASVVEHHLQRLNRLHIVSWILGFCVALLLWFMSPSFHRFVGISDGQILLWQLVVMGLLFFPLGFARGAINALEVYLWASLVIIVEMLSKLSMGLMTLWLDDNFFWASWSVPVSHVMAVAVAFAVLRWYKMPLSFRPLDWRLQREEFQLWAQSIVLGIGVLLPMSIDMILVKHYVDADTAGIYALVSFVGKSLFFLMYSVVGLLIPVLSVQLARGKEDKRLLWLVIGFVALMTSLTVGIFHWLPGISLAIFVGDKAGLIEQYVTLYILAIGSLMVAAAVATFHLMHKNYLFPVLVLSATSIQMIMLSVWHATVMEIVTVMFWVYAGLALVMLVLHVLQMVSSIKVSDNEIKQT